MPQNAAIKSVRNMKAINEKTKKWADLVDRVKFYNHKEHTDRLMSGVVAANGGLLAYMGGLVQTSYKNLTEEQAKEWASYILTTKITCECGTCKNRQFFKTGKEIPASF